MVFYCTELYKLYSNFGGNYIPYGDGFHTASLMIDVYEDINEQSVYVREDEIWKALALTNIRF